MTIAIAIRTRSAVIFAADSKVTTAGIVGIEEDGSPRWLEQTYDNATKVIHDRSRTLMAMVAGHANIGQETATDFVARRTIGTGSSAEEQNGLIRGLVDEMVQQKRAYWESTKVEPAQWPGPTLLLAAPSFNRISPRIWRAKLDGHDSSLTAVLDDPGIRLEGSYDEVFSLMYGFDWGMFTELCEQLGVEKGKAPEMLGKLKTLRPIDKINFATMPIQDAIDMAVFLAEAQVQMDRFLPGTAACGGPIDIMVLHTAPEPGILAYPGKVLHHPTSPRS